MNARDEKEGKEQSKAWPESDIVKEREKKKKNRQEERKKKNPLWKRSAAEVDRGRGQWVRKESQVWDPTLLPGTLTQPWRRDNYGCSRATATHNNHMCHICINPRRPAHAIQTTTISLFAKVNITIYSPSGMKRKLPSFANWEHWFQHLLSILALVATRIKKRHIACQIFFLNWFTPLLSPQTLYLADSL